MEEVRSGVKSVRGVSFDGTGLPSKFAQNSGVLRISVSASNSRGARHYPTYMHLYVPDFLCQVGLAYLGGYAFIESTHPAAH
jgi:hypothetical protein